ncbi:MAG: hypothetical protein IIZ44_11100 [Muribaculaceae bacterium]|nr:hypothetical protein [Muribaculaceae bacterium]
MEVTLNGTSYKIRWSLRAQIFYEALKSQSQDMGQTMDTLMYYFAILMTSNPGIDITIDQFIDACDASVLKAFRDLIEKDEEMRKLINGNDDEAVGEKKS